MTLVSLPADPDAEHLEFAATQPGPTDTVLVRSADPIVVTMDELATLEVDEATPVMDGRGRLVGLCTGSPDDLARGTCRRRADAAPHDDDGGSDDD